MNKRLAWVSVLLGIVLLLPVLAVGAIGCGEEEGTTTTLTPPPSAEMAAGDATTDAAAPSDLFSASLAGVNPEFEQYRTEMLGFVQALAALPAADDPSKFTDVSAITIAQLAAAKEYVSGIQSAIAQLKAIQPPAELADAHQEVVAGIEALAATADKLIMATEEQDQSAFDAALTEGQAALQALQDATEALGELLGGTTPST